jgi:hypothetical protein
MQNYWAVRDYTLIEMPRERRHRAHLKITAARQWARAATCIVVIASVASAP